MPDFVAEKEITESFPPGVFEPETTNDKTGLDEIKKKLLDPRIISKTVDAQGRIDTANEVLEARRRALGAKVAIASREKEIEASKEKYLELSEVLAGKVKEKTAREEKFLVRAKRRLGIGDKTLNVVDSEINSVKSQINNLGGVVYGKEDEIKEIRDTQESVPDSRKVLNAYYEKVATTPLTVEEKREYLTPEMMASLTTQEYIALWRRLEPHFLTHVTRQGFRDHNAMMYHSGGLQAFHTGFESALQDGKSLRPPIAVDGLLDRSEASVRRIQENWVLQSENEEQAMERWNNLLNFSLGSAPTYPDRTAVHFAAELVANAFYGGETDNEVFFIFPSDFVASQHEYAFNGFEKTFTEPQSETKWNDVFVWPKDQDNPRIDLDAGIVFLPRSTVVDRETGSKYASEMREVNGRQVRAMVENTQLKNDFIQWYKQLGPESKVMMAFNSLAEEPNYYRRQDLRENFLRMTSSLLVDLGVPKDSSVELAGKVHSELSDTREISEERLIDALKDSRAIWKRAENLVTSQAYWERYFEDHQELKPAHIVFYDGGPTAAIFEFQRNNGIGDSSKRGENKGKDPLLGFGDNHVSDMSEDPRANAGYRELFELGNRIIHERYSNTQTSAG